MLDNGLPIIYLYYYSAQLKVVYNQQYSAFKKTKKLLK